MPNPDPNLAALIKLLSDDHPAIVDAARKKLLELGAPALAVLKRAANSDPDPKIRVGSRQILEQVRMEKISREWAKAAAVPDDKLDLETNAFLLARIPYPDLDPALYRRRLDELAEQIRPALKPSAAPQELLRVINRILFKKERFRGNWDNYFDPQNSYLNCVLDRRLGIPISLSVLYLLVAWRLKIPVQGVGIPGHFMLKYAEQGTELYVDPFNEGRFLTRAECIQFIVEAGYPYQADFMEGVGSREILARMLRNLILIYVDRQEVALERILTYFLNSLYPEQSGEATENFSDEEPGPLG